ncbi:hypothetical protein ACGFZK_20605 [Streptomyces sp. NPDC048257]|uniref:hypothetical protein n=1 Tax=Streptomyces sp. NPDC048257 TaxID=3365526 RepID=UPI0037243471
MKVSAQEAQAPAQTVDAFCLAVRQRVGAASRVEAGADGDQRDRGPLAHRDSRVRRYFLLGRESGGQACAVQLAAPAAIALGTESAVVQNASREEQFVVVVAVGQQALLLR